MKSQIDKMVKKLETEIKKKIQKVPELSDYKLRANPPATAAQIAKYEKHLDRELPRSYRAFLELHNGYEGLAFPGSMLAIEDLMPRGVWHPRIEKWKKRMASAGNGAVLDGIIIANLGQGNYYVYLDPNRPSGPDELTVVEKDAGDEPDDYANVLEFLEECLETAKY
jgi:hypothetical protein